VGINRSSPASDALHPVAAEQTADVSLVGKLVAIGERVQRLRVNGGVRELVESSGDDTEGKHELRHILVAGKAQSGRTHVERVVLGSAQVVVCGAPLAVEVSGERDLVSLRGAVSTSHQTGQTNSVSREGISPVEALEGSGGVIADAADGPAHDVVIHRLRVTSLLDGDAGRDNGVGHIQLHDLSGKLNVSGEHGGVQSVVRGGLNFLHGIDTERELLGRADAVFVGLELIHDVVLLVIDSEDSAGEGSASGETVDRTVALRGLDDLNLTQFGSVLPFNHGGVASQNGEALDLVIEDVALGCHDFTDVILAVLKGLIQMDVALVVRLIFADRCHGAVVHDELNALDTLFGYGVDFVDKHRCGGGVLELEGLGLALLHFDFLRSRVEQVALGGLDFGQLIPTVIEVGELDDAQFIRHIGSDDFAVQLCDFNLSAFQTLARLRVNLDDGKAAERRIVIAIGNPPLLSQLDWDSQGGLSPASHRACDFHRTRRSINANYLLRVCEITSLSL